MPSKPMIARSVRGPYDELYTPDEAFVPLLPYIPEKSAIWELCPGPGNLVTLLKEYGNYVISDSTKNSFVWEPDEPYDYAITNPPYSNKHEWLERCQSLGKPFALLLPVATLGVRRCQVHLHDVDVLFLPKRIDFTGKKAPWFAVAWFTKGLGLPDRMVFA